MSKASFRLGARVATLIVVGLALVANSAAARPRPGRGRALNLFSGILDRQNVNRWDCGLNAFGEVCVDPNGSTTVGGGFWPKGTPDQYVFDSGLQVTGIINPAIAGFPWAGDTTGSYWFDPSGAITTGDKLSLMWSTLNSTDVTNWPRDAYVPDDTTLYFPALVGLKAASQQDTWAQYWDGNPALNAGRPHPIGVLVTQRGLAWNYPTGNEDVIYFLYTFTNISAKDPAVYAGLPNADSLTNLGTRFQTLNEAAFSVQIPDSGYTITNMYAAFAMDADVSGNGFSSNYSTAFLPFNMGTAYNGTFTASEFKFTPASAFSFPLAPAVGFVGVKYLKSPVDPNTQQEVGLTLFSNTINGGQFGDALNVKQGWRYMSGLLDPSAGDPPCSAGGSLATHYCYVTQSTDDIRFFQSSGPFSLAPGKSATIVVAYIAAAPVARPEIAARGAGFDLKPGLPMQPDVLTDTLRTIDKVMGAEAILGDTNGNGRIDQFEIKTTPRSLLNKGLVAQAVFDNKFLLPFSPASPEFFVVPGDNQVTVVWRPSPSEQTGDPYFVVAQKPGALNDPNYREFDIEGYRIYRGRTSGDLQLIAQFDYAGTEMKDFTAEFDYGNCAPELGVLTDCPTDLATGHSQPLVGSIIQIAPGGRVQLADSSILVTATDTAFGKNAEAAPNLADTGVPFAFTDHAVQNGFRYFYAVTAFDVNSLKSVGQGSAVLESPRSTKSVIPRVPAGQSSGANLFALKYLNAKGDSLDPTAPLPTLSAANGTFSGPMPITNGVTLGLTSFLPELLGTGSVDIRIDSIVPGAGSVDFADLNTPSVYWFTALADSSKVAVPIQTQPEDVTTTSQNAIFTGTAIVTSKSRPYGGDSTYNLYGLATFSTPGAWRLTSPGRGAINDDPTGGEHSLPRWWAGSPNENTNDPNGIVCVPAAGDCVQADLSRNAGSLPGVDSIFLPSSYLTVPNVPMRDIEGTTHAVMRAADFRVYWGTGGAIDSVIDVTHGVPVPFSPAVRASWGILNDSSFVNVIQDSTPDADNTVLSWTDIACVAPIMQYIVQTDTTLPTYCVGTPPAVLMNHARATPIAITASGFDDGALAATGDGFIFYLNGDFFLMQLTGGTLPTAGTVWNARFFSGNIVGSAGSYTFQPALRPPAVPGLRLSVRYTGSTLNQNATTDADLARIHTVPDPYYVTNAFEQSPNAKRLRFVNLPSRCIIRIYSLSGVLVQAITLDDPTGGGEAEWNLRNRNNQFVASGVYFYHVETPDGKSKVGRFTVVNFAQ